MLLLLHLAGAAVYYDLRYQRIPNRLIVAGLFLGLLYQIDHSRWMGLIEYSAGVVLPVAVLFILLYFRMMGAGDIKLLSVIGGFLGPMNGLRCIIYTFLFGSIIAVVLLIKRRNLYSRLCYFKTYLFQYLKSKQWSPYMQQEDRDSHFYFSVPVFLSLLCFLGGVY